MSGATQRQPAAFVEDRDFTLYQGEALDVLCELEDESVNCVVTSPPYWGLRDYGDVDQLGLEPTPQLYVQRLVGICDELRRVLRADGTFWLVIGDSFNNRSVARRSSHQGGLGFESEDLSKSWAELTTEGRTRLSINDGVLKEKDLVGIPWRVAFALQDAGWWLRCDVIWSKLNGMTESVTDRPTRSHEYVFMLSKSARYWYDQDAVREPNHPDGRRKTVHDTRTDKSHENYRGRTGGGKERWPNEEGRNRRSVWEIATEPYPDAHFAVYPQALVEVCVKAGCPEGGVVLDPFMGAGTTALVARRLGRRSIGIELKADYCEQIARRLGQQSLLSEAL